MAMKLSLHRTKLLMHFEGEQGYLVCVDGHLAAVLIRLEAEFHGGDRGSWNLEAGFGPCEMRSCDPFPDLADALTWVADRVGAPASSAAAALKSIGHDLNGPAS